MKKEKNKTRKRKQHFTFGKDRKERIFATLALMIMTAPQLTTYVWAANPITTPLKSFYDIVAGIISAVGSLILLWGFLELGLAFQSSEGSMQANGFKRITGGLVIVFAPQLVPLLT